MRKERRIIRILAVCMCALVLFVGCGKGEEKAEQSNRMEAEKDRILMTVGKEKVSVEEAEAYACFLKHQYEGSIGRAIWDCQMEGKSLSDYARKEIQGLLSQVKILKQVAAKLEISLSEDEREEARAGAIDFLEDITESEKERYGLREELLMEIYAENILANKVFEISTNDIDTTVLEDEVKQITIQYLAVLTKGTDKNGNSVDMTVEEKGQARKRAGMLLKEARDVTNFLTFAEYNTDEKEVKLTFSRATAPKELADAAFRLRSGEMSGIVEGENGYYIIYCVNDDDEDATARRKEELILERQKLSFQEKFKEWSAEYDIIIQTSLWNALEF